MKRIFVLITIAIFTLTACTGTFKLTKTVHNIQRSHSEKWVDEVLFLGCVILPIYWFSLLGDAIIFNSIEFWTGRNPLKNLAGLEERRTIQDGENRVVISRGYNADTINIESNLSPNAPLTIQKSDKGVFLMDSTGKVLYTSSKDDNGGVSVFDKNMMLVKYFSPKEVSGKQL